MSARRRTPANQLEQSEPIVNKFLQNQMTPSNQFQADDTFPQIDFHNLGFDAEEKKIDYPEIEYFGFKHGDQTAKLATVIVSHLPGANTPVNLKTTWLAGYFHDIGRSERNWRIDDENCAKRSAELVEFILKGTQLWADEDLRYSIGRLIAQNTKRPNTKDHLAAALWDAERYESARFAPGTMEGLQNLKANTAPSMLITDWANNKDHLKIHMDNRGW